MIGQTLGSYRVVSEIGVGGMGVVYLAEHVMIGRKVALKLLRPDLGKDYVERFFNEAKAAAKLHHPGLVDVFDFGHHTDGRAFIVMEYLQGESLAERLEHDPRMAVPIACTIARSVALSLEIAHEQGIVHRDLKPGNIFLVPDPDAPAGVRTKVLDFGIAKLVRDQGTHGVNTQSGAVIGTPRYMSPEQCKNAKNVDARSDIYSLGCILFEMLLGVAPFDYDNWAELVGAHIYELAPRPTEIDPKLPEDVEILVCKMLEKSPDDRFSSMQQLAESLEVLLRRHGAAPVRLTPPGVISTPPRGVRRVESAQAPTLPAGTGEPQAARPATDRRLGTDPTVTPSTLDQPRKTPWLAIGLASVGLGALGVAGALVLGKSDAKPEVDPTYVVVDQRGSAEPPIVQPTVQPTVPVDAAVSEPVAIDAGVTPTRPNGPEDLVGKLTRTFAAQNNAISACFNQHPTTSGEAISVRLAINTKGTVTRADVLPESIATTPLGGCIATVAKSTKFGPQTRPIAFKAPLVRGR